MLFVMAYLLLYLPFQLLYYLLFETRVFRKQPLYVHKVASRGSGKVCIHSNLLDLTCGNTLDMLFLLLLLCI